MSSGFQMSDGAPHFMINHHRHLQSQHDWANYELLKKILATQIRNFGPFTNSTKHSSLADEKIARIK